MRNFKDVIGQKQIIEHFQNAIQADKISHVSFSASSII